MSNTTQRQRYHSEEDTSTSSSRVRQQQIADNSTTSTDSTLQTDALCSVPRYMGTDNQQSQPTSSYDSWNFIDDPALINPLPTEDANALATEPQPTSDSTQGDALQSGSLQGESQQIDPPQSDSLQNDGETFNEQSMQCIDPQQDANASQSSQSQQENNTVQRTQQRQRQQKKQPLPAPVIPRTGYIIAPRVPSPPKESLKRSEQIRQRTGSPPEMHHAKIQQSVLRVVDAARQGQRQIVFRATNLAKDTRLSLDEMADEIVSFVGSCVRRVRNAVTQAKQDITTAVDAQLQHMWVFGTKVGDELQQSKKENQALVHDRLLSESSELNQAHTQLQGEFNPYLEDAKRGIKNIDKWGEAYHIIPPAGGETTPPPAGQPNESRVPPGPRKDLKTTLKELKTELQTIRGSNDLGVYHAHRIAPVLQSQHDSTKIQLQNNLDTQANALDSYRGEFTNYVLRLTTPIARDFQQDRRNDEQRIEQQLEDDRHSLALGMGEHGETLINKFDGVIARLDDELQPRLVTGLQSAGRKAANSFREQGKMTQRMMVNTSASLALAYPELVARVAEMLPPDQFLNAEELVPRLMDAWQSARNLPDQQYKAMAEQAATSLAQAKAGQKKQLAALADTADKSLQSVSDVVTVTCFDFDSFGFQVTGTMREGGWASVTNAANYAERMAQQMLETRGEADGHLNNLIRNFCTSLNGAIDNSGVGYFQAVQSFRDAQNGTSKTSVFRAIKEEINTDLSRRSQTLNAELTKPNPKVTTGLVILNVLTLGATVPATAAYLIYSDADDDEVFAAFADLRWPGQPALAYYFENESDYGNLETRFNECLSSAQARRANNMFHSDDLVRGKARESAIRNTFTLFGMDSDVRRGLGQGFHSTERTAIGERAMNQLVSDMRNSWTAWFSSNTDLRINEGNMRGDVAMVLSARMEHSLRTARAKGSDRIFQSVANIEQMAREELARGQSARFLSNEQVQAITDQAMQDFASHRRGETRSREQISVSDAREVFISAATADVYVARGAHRGPRGTSYGGHPQGGPHARVPIDQGVRQYIEEVVRGGWQSEDALAAKQAYELTHAGRGGRRPSETDQVRVTRAMQDPELDRAERELRENPGRRDELMPRIERLRRRREERMRRLALRLDPNLTPQQLDQAGGATQYMAQRTARLFSGGSDYNTRLSATDYHSRAQEDAQYGYELVTRGRASLTAGIRLATRGVGTNEDLLRMNFQGRSRAEVNEARSQWQSRYHENLDEMLGIRPRRLTTAQKVFSVLSPAVAMFAYGGETSGDLAMEIERLARGEPVTDQDHIELAALRYNQQRRRGTGLLARITMSNTAEARVIDQRQQEMAAELLAVAQRQRARRASDPNFSGAEDIRLPDSTDGVFLPDGRVNPVIASLVFGPGPGASSGSPPVFLGDRNRVFDLSHSIELAGNRYQAELDRQESLMLAGITVLAIAATVILMAFGVGFVLAGVLVALGSGLLTMAVKSGMRGERYGWEEAATDAAQTAIEVVAAGAGGALGGGLGRANALAKVGQTLVRRLGPVGGVVAREAMVGAVSSAAQTAIQDNTYRDGPGAAFGRILLGGVKGAAISAVSAGVSESVGNRMNRSLSGALEGTDPSRMARMGQGLGPSGRNMLKEGVSEALGGMAGEAAGIYIELMSGQFQGGLKEALKRLGQAGLKDMVSSAGRAGVTSRNRRSYNRLMAEARSNPRLTDSDLRALRTASVAAGNPPESLATIRNQVQSDRAALTLLPPEIQSLARSMDSDSLQSMTRMLQGGELGNTSSNRHELFMNISERNPQLDTQALLRDLESNSQRLTQPTDDADGTPTLQRQEQLRGQLTADLPGPVRDALTNIPVRGMEDLPASELPKVAKMLAQGTIDMRDAESLVRVARQQNPDLDAVTFLKNLNSAVQSARMAQDAHTRIVVKQRASVLQDVPEAAIGLFARLPDDDISTVRGLLDQGKMPAADQQETLYRNALTLDPTLERAQFKQILQQATDNAVQRRTQEQSEARSQRREQMTNVPENLRDTLSVLPDSALVELHLRQMEGSISPAERLRLEQAALRERPELDLKAFNKALDNAVERGTPIQPSPEQSRQMREELLAAVPANQRDKVQNTPILVMDDAAFARFTRSESGNAVTLILNGKAVVVMRQNAELSVLREEGIHALQAQDPRWASHLARLDENHLQHWDDLPLDVQMALYRNKLELEIDAHDQMVDGLSSRLRQSDDPAGEARLRLELEATQRTLNNLQNRMSEVDAVGPLQRLQISAGITARPQWLNQPARLFSKAPNSLLQSAQAGLKPQGRRAKQIERLLNELDPADHQRLQLLDLDADELRRVLSKNDSKADTQRLLLELETLRQHLPEENRANIFKQLSKRSDFFQLLPILRASAELSGDSAGHIIRAVAELTTSHVETANSILNHLRSSTPEQRQNFADLIQQLGPNSRVQLMGLMQEINTTAAALNMSAAQIRSMQAGMIEAAAGYVGSQRLDLLRQTQNLMAALSRLPDSEQRTTVLNHIKQGFINADDLQQHALDVRAASRRLDDGELSSVHLNNFAQSTSKGNLTGGDAYQLHLAEKSAQWDAFANDPRTAPFARLVENTFPHLSPEHRAVLADMQPWFQRIVNSSSFQQRVQQAGGREQAQAALLRELFINGLRLELDLSKLPKAVAEGLITQDRRNAYIQQRADAILRGELSIDSAPELKGRMDVNNFTTLRRMMAEVRQEMVGTTPEPNFNARVRAEMERMGLKPKLLDDLQNDEAFQNRLFESQRHGEQLPEVHLENLLRQKIEYQRMEAAALAIARSRHQNDPGAQRMLYNQLTAGLKQKITEAIGEIAATQAILTNKQYQGMTIQRGFEAGTGYDQVWVRRNDQGEVIEILIVEAKGPGAGLGNPQKGRQMGPQWVRRTAEEMLTNNDPGAKITGTLIHDAIQNGRPPISGVVIQARDRDGNPGDIQGAPGTNGPHHRYKPNQLQSDD